MAYLLIEATAFCSFSVTEHVNHGLWDLRLCWFPV